MSQLFTVSPNFSGHETFPFRYSWIKKGIDAIRQDPLVFSSDDAIVHLGVGKNMVRSIRHWCLTLQLAKVEGRALRPTALGELLFGENGHDPYLEDSGTLWLLHWMLATNEQRATTWYWVFSHIHRSEITKDELVHGLVDQLSQMGPISVSEETIARDVDCFIRTYVPSRVTASTLVEDTFDCPLNELRLISEADRKTYRFNKGSQGTLPDLIFAHAVLSFWSRSEYNERRSISFADLAHRPGSPGRVFRLDENTMAERLTRLESLTDHLFIYDETSGLRQLYRGEREVGPYEFLNRYYRAAQRSREVSLC